MEIFGIIPFAGLEPWQLVSVAALYIFAFFLKGVFGYGAIPTLVVGGSLIIEPHHAVLLAAVANLFTHAQFLPVAFRDGDRNIALRLGVWIVPAIAVGVYFFARTDTASLSLSIGVLIMALVLAEVFGVTRRFEPLLRRNTSVAGPIAAAFSGLMAGFIGAGAMLVLSVYLRILVPDHLRFRATVLQVATVFILWRSAVLIGTGIVGMTLLVEGLLLAPIAMAAAHLGTRLLPYLPAALFFRLYQGLLIFASLLLIWDGLRTL